MIEIHNLLHNIELPLLEAVADLRESSIDRSDLVLHLGACCVLPQTFHCFCGGGLFFLLHQQLRFRRFEAFLILIQRLFQFERTEVRLSSTTNAKLTFTQSLRTMLLIHT